MTNLAPAPFVGPAAPAPPAPRPAASGRPDRIPWQRIAYPTLAMLYMAAATTFDFSLPRLILLPLGAFVLGAVFVSSHRDPSVMLLALATYIPFSRVFPGNFGGEITALNLTNVLTVMALLVWLNATKRQGLPLFPQAPLNVPVVLFAVLSVVAFVRGGMDMGAWYWSGAIFNLKRWLDPFLVYFIFLGLTRRKDTMRNLVIIVLIAVLVASLMGFPEHFDRMDRYFGTKESDKVRIEGIAAQPNQLGAFFVYYGILFAALALARPWSFRHLLLLIPYGLIVRTTQYTGSRGTLVGLAAAIMGLCFLRSKALFVGFALLATVIVTNTALLPEGTQRMIGRTVVREGEDLEDSLDKSAAVRIKLWSAALAMVQAEPILGVGYGLFPQFAPLFNPEVDARDVHNTYLLLAAEMGLPTLLVFLWLLARILRESVQLYRRTTDRFFRGVGLGYTAGLCGLMVICIFGSRITSFEIFAYFWVLAAIVVRANALERAERLVQARARAPVVAPWVGGVPART